MPRPKGNGLDGSWGEWRLLEEVPTQNVTSTAVDALL